MITGKVRYECFKDVVCTAKYGRGGVESVLFMRPVWSTEVEEVCVLAATWLAGMQTWQAGMKIF